MLRRAGPLRLVGAAERRIQGDPKAGQRLLQGRLLWRGYSVEAPGVAPWDMEVPEPCFAAEMHSFGWLPDLVSTGTSEAQALARDWTEDWLTRFGQGEGPGWAAATIGRRVLVLLYHRDVLFPWGGQGDLGRSLYGQILWLERVWTEAEGTESRLTCLLARLLAALHVDGRQTALPQILRDLAADMPLQEANVRNPEAWARTFFLLAWMRADLAEAGHPVPDALATALAQMVPVLRTLRGTDGGLPRFHGGGAGPVGALDRALALSWLRGGAAGDQALGYHRLTHGRSTVFVDGGTQGTHLSALGFELTSGRRPIVTSCGPGERFGPDWEATTRRTASHSALELGGISHASEAVIRTERRRTAGATGLNLSHDGYVTAFGLVHHRRLLLSFDGRELAGEDLLATVDRAQEQRFDAISAELGGGVPFRVHFHLYPQISVTEHANSITLRTRGGEIWEFRAEGPVRMALESTYFLDDPAPEPVLSTQIVLSGRASDYATRLRWTLAKARQTPDAVRDVEHTQDPVLL
ncbi:heparinase II/III family protein [Palleronia caenipelagi]|nr:heparinase II/III family protein [Palleronia caenipelagi]